MHLPEGYEVEKHVLCDMKFLKDGLLLITENKYIMLKIEDEKVLNYFKLMITKTEGED
jgi:hypothetical protein